MRELSRVGGVGVCPWWNEMKDGTETEKVKQMNDTNKHHVGMYENTPKKKKKQGKNDFYHLWGEQASGPTTHLLLSQVIYL